MVSRRIGNNVAWRLSYPPITGRISPVMELEQCGEDGTRGPARRFRPALFLPSPKGATLVARGSERLER
jgi:hypothetical protein